MIIAQLLIFFYFILYLNKNIKYTLKRLLNLRVDY